MADARDAAHRQVLIIGGGAAGVSLAANLRPKNRGVAVNEPGDVHTSHMDRFLAA